VIGGVQKGVNLGQVRVIAFNYNSTTYEAFFLVTTSEYYHDSVIFSALKGINETAMDVL